MQQDKNKNKYFTKVIIFSEVTLPRFKALPQGTLPRSFKNDLCLHTQCNSLDVPLVALLTSFPNCNSLLFGCRQLCCCLISNNLSLWKCDFLNCSRWLWAFRGAPCLQGWTAPDTRRNLSVRLSHCSFGFSLLPSDQCLPLWSTGAWIHAGAFLPGSKYKY